MFKWVLNVSGSGMVMPGPWITKTFARIIPVEIMYITPPPSILTYLEIRGGDEIISRLSCIDFFIAIVTRSARLSSSGLEKKSRNKTLINSGVYYLRKGSRISLKLSRRLTTLNGVMTAYLTALSRVKLSEKHIITMSMHYIL